MGLCAFHLRQVHIDEKWTNDGQRGICDIENYKMKYIYGGGMDDNAAVVAIILRYAFSYAERVQQEEEERERERDTTTPQCCSESF